MEEVAKFRESKKIFFLYPISIIFDILKDIIKYGYEAYIIKDHRKLIKILEKHPNSIIYINIYEKMKDENWENYIIKILNNPLLKNVQIGICVYNSSVDDELSKKYLVDYSMMAGYINLYINYKKSLESLLKILEVLEAHGSRRYVRVKPFLNDLNTCIFVDYKKTKLRGNIIDLSVACTAVEFNRHYFVKNELLKGVTIKLRGVVCTSDMIVLGHKEDNDKIYVLAYIHKKVENKEKIFSYIFERLQTEIQDA